MTDEFLTAAKGLAEIIAKEPGVIWKIWTHEAGTNHFGSTYLFKDVEHLETYKAMPDYPYMSESGHKALISLDSLQRSEVGSWRAIGYNFRPA